MKRVIKAVAVVLLGSFLMGMTGCSALNDLFSGKSAESVSNSTSNSGTVQGATPNITQVTASATHSWITIQCAKPAQFSGVGFNIYYSMQENGAYTKLDWTSNPQFTFSMPVSAVDGKYYFRIRATDSDLNESPYSAPVLFDYKGNELRQANKEIIEEARYLLEQGKFDQAVALCRTVLTNDPQNGLANLVMAVNSLTAIIENPATQTIAGHYTSTFPKSFNAIAQASFQGQSLNMLFEVLPNPATPNVVIADSTSMIENVILPQLDNGLTYLNQLKKSSARDLTLTPQMTGLKNAIKLDQGDLQVFIGFVSMIQALLHQVVAYDYTLNGSADSKDYPSVAAFLEQNPSFGVLRPQGAAHMQQALDSLKNAVASYKSAVQLISADYSGRSNQVFKNVFNSQSMTGYSYYSGYYSYQVDPVMSAATVTDALDKLAYGLNGHAILLHFTNPLDAKDVLNVQVYPSALFMNPVQNIRQYLGVNWQGKQTLSQSDFPTGFDFSLNGFLGTGATYASTRTYYEWLFGLYKHFDDDNNSTTTSVPVQFVGDNAIVESDITTGDYDYYELPIQAGYLYRFQISSGLKIVLVNKAGEVQSSGPLQTSGYYSDNNETLYLRCSSGITGALDIRNYSITITKQKYTFYSTPQTAYTLAYRPTENIRAVSMNVMAGRNDIYIKMSADTLYQTDFHLGQFYYSFAYTITDESGHSLTGNSWGSVFKMTDADVTGNVTLKLTFQDYYSSVPSVVNLQFKKYPLPKYGRPQTAYILQYGNEETSKMVTTNMSADRNNLYMKMSARTLYQTDFQISSEYGSCSYTVSDENHHTYSGSTYGGVFRVVDGYVTGNVTLRFTMYSYNLSGNPLIYLQMTKAELPMYGSPQTAYNVKSVDDFGSITVNVTSGRRYAYLTTTAQTLLQGGFKLNNYYSSLSYLIMDEQGHTYSGNTYGNVFQMQTGSGVTGNVLVRLSFDNVYNLTSVGITMVKMFSRINGTFETACSLDALAADEKLTFAVPQSYEYYFFKFTVNPGQTVQILPDLSNNYVYWDIYNLSDAAQFQTLANGTVYSWSPSPISYSLAGTYVLRLKPSSTGAFTIGITKN